MIFLILYLQFRSVSTSLLVWSGVAVAWAGGFLLLPLFLPWLDRARVKSIRYRGWMYKSALTIFVVTFLGLGWLGTQPADGLYVLLARILSVVYFLFFLLMPIYSKLDKTKPVPERVT